MVLEIEVLEREGGRLVHAEADVCERITDALQVRFTPPIPAGRPRNVGAYTRYLKGHHLTKRQTPADLQRGYEYFQEAIRLDPSYALPYHGAALYYILRATFGSSPAHDALPEADALLSTGLGLDDSIARPSPWNPATRIRT